MSNHMVKIIFICFVLLSVMITSISIGASKAYSLEWRIVDLTQSNDGPKETFPHIEGDYIVWKTWGAPRRDGVLLWTGKVLRELSKGLGGYHTGVSISKRQVVWRRWDFAKTGSIYLYSEKDGVRKIRDYDIGPFEPFNGFPPSYHSLDPSIHDGKVAWAEWDGSNYQIMFYDGIKVIQITNNGRDNIEPSVFDGKIAYTSMEHGQMSTSETYLWDGFSHINLSNNPGREDWDTHFNGGKIVWSGWAGTTNGFDIFMWDGKNVMNLSNRPGYDFQPRISGTDVVWRGDGNGYWDIFLLHKGQTYNLTNSPQVDELEPWIDGNRIVWMKVNEDNGSNDYNVQYAVFGDCTGELEHIGQHDTPGFARDLKVREDYLLVADDWAGLRVLNVSDPSVPEEVGKLSGLGNVWALDTYGDFGYLAARENGIIVVDIVDPLRPQLVRVIDTPDAATDVFVSDQYLFVADRNTGLLIYSITDPANPQLISQYDTPGLAVGVYAVGHLAYVADHWAGLQVVDFSDAWYPAQAGSLGVPGKIWDVKAEGNYIYVASEQNGLQVIDASDLQQMRVVGSVQTPDEPEGTCPVLPPCSVQLIGKYALLGDGGSGIQVIDVEDKEHPRVVDSLQLDGFSWGLEVSGMYIFVGAYKSGVHVLEISPCLPADMPIIPPQPHLGWPEHIGQHAEHAGCFCSVLSKK